MLNVLLSKLKSKNLLSEMERKNDFLKSKLIEKAEEIKALKMELKQEMDSKLDMEREYKEDMDIRNFILDKAFSELCNLSKSKESFSKEEDCLCLQTVIKDLLSTTHFNIYNKIYNIINGNSEVFKDLEEFKDLEKKKLHLELLNPDKESTYPVNVDALVINKQVLRLIKGYLAILKFSY